VVIEEARHVADDLGLPYWWLNEQASIYISGKDDPSKRRVFDHPGLRYFALDGTDHASHREQASMIRRYIIWRSNHACDERLRRVVARPTLA
jgi:hypothetical protein